MSIFTLNTGDLNDNIPSFADSEIASFIMYAREMPNIGIIVTKFIVFFDGRVGGGVPVV